MINKEYNELEKAILNSDFIKNNSKLDNAEEFEKTIEGAKKIKQTLLGYFSSRKKVPKENFYGVLKELGMVQNKEQYKKITSEVENNENGIFLCKGGFNPIMRISKMNQESYFFDCYDPEYRSCVEQIEFPSWMLK